jgi:hypothetical protein
MRRSWIHLAPYRYRQLLDELRRESHRARGADYVALAR